MLSLDFCADQFLVALADRPQIAAISHDAANDRSYLAESLEGLPRTGDDIEEIISFNPDLVLRVWGGGYRVDDLLLRFGIPVLTIPFTQDLDELRQSMRAAGQALGHPARAEAMIDRMDRRLAAVRNKAAALPEAARPRALYLTPGGATTGGGTLVDAMMRAAGLRNLMAEGGRQGWYHIDPEELLMTRPDVVVLGFQDLSTNPAERWNPGRQEAVRRFVAARPSAAIPSRVLSCSAWYFVDGVEAIFDQLVAPVLAAGGTQQGGQP